MPKRLRLDHNLDPQHIDQNGTFSYLLVFICLTFTCFQILRELCGDILILHFDFSKYINLAFRNQSIYAGCSTFLGYIIVYFNVGGAQSTLDLLILDDTVEFDLGCVIIPI